MWAFGFTLNTMSLLGLSLAIGILIDDAIVVRENIVRHVEMGKDHYTAAREGTDEIGLAVAATTFSIVCVFVPIAFMGGLAEQWFAPFALTIACSVLVSLFVSFSLDPMLSAYWPDPHREEHEKSFITRALDKFNRWFDRRSDDYRKVIGWALDHALAMILIAVGTFVGALVVPAKGIFAFLAVMVVIAAAVVALSAFRYPRGYRGGLMKGGVAVAAVVMMFVAIGVAPAGGKLGFEFFPKDDNSEILVDIDTPPGSSLEYTRLKSEEVASMARRIPEVLYTYTTIGGQGGSVDQGNVYVRLQPKAERQRGQEEIAAILREEAKRIGGATAALGTGNFGGTKQIMIQLQGPDIAVLNRLAEQVEAEVRKVPGAVDVGLSTKGQKPELTVELNRGLAGSLNTNTIRFAAQQITEHESELKVVTVGRKGQAAMRRALGEAARQQVRAGFGLAAAVERFLGHYAGREAVARVGGLMRTFVRWRRIPALADVMRLEGPLDPLEVESVLEGVSASTRVLVPA